MSVAGRLRLGVRWRDGRVDALRVDNSRPLAAHLLVGREVDEAVGLSSAVFSLCGRAQGLAARCAVDAALGRPVGADRTPFLAVAAETAQEHLWRLLLDWPPLLGAAPRREQFAALHRLLQDAPRDPAAAAEMLRALVAESGLGEPGLAGVDEVLAAMRSAGELGRSLAPLVAERSEPCGPATALLPTRPAREWSRALDGLPSSAFCRAPAWAGAPAETGALARCADVPVVATLLAAGRRLAARVLSRVLELGLLAEVLEGRRALQADAAAPEPGIGLAWVETARGLLLHAVSVNAGRVVDYRIVAPTEWNFHPAGVFVREAESIRAADAESAVECVKRLALALDPCVSWDVELDAEGAHA